MENNEMEIIEQDIIEQTQPSGDKLTERQLALYQYIYNHSKLDMVVSQEDICRDLADYGYEWKEKSSSTHDNCTMIWGDIQKINLSLEVDSVIISKNFEYWIGDMNETKQYLKDLWKALRPRLYRYWQFTKKVNRDGQYVAKESGNTRVIEAFIEGQDEEMEG